MAVKTIIRWKPPNELYSGRQLERDDLRRVGILNQTKNLVWTRETGFWIDADGVSPDLIKRLGDPEFSNDQLGHFTVEEQEVPDEEETPAPTSRAASQGRKVRDNPQA